MHVVPGLEWQKPIDNKVFLYYQFRSHTFFIDIIRMDRTTVYKNVDRIRSIYTRELMDKN